MNRYDEEEFVQMGKRVVKQVLADLDAEIMCYDGRPCRANDRIEELQTALSFAVEWNANLVNALTDVLAMLDGLKPDLSNGVKDHSGTMDEGEILAATILDRARAAVAKGATTFAATELGRKGGQSTSEAKRAAVRENGKRGGRPKKKSTDTVKLP